MARTRIRWRNVGRLAGGVALGAVVLFAGADLLEPPPPEPLPPDVGLATGASGVAGVPLEPRPVEQARERERPREKPPAARPQGNRPSRVAAKPEPPRRRQPREPDRERDDPAPAIVAAVPAPTPAPVPPQPAMPPAPEPAESEPEPGDVKAEFGFEPRP